MESAHFRKTGDLISLSEQNLVDCVSINSTGGDRSSCQSGGWPKEAVEHVILRGGIASSEAYPSRNGAPGDCDRSTRKAATMTSVHQFKPNNEDELKRAVATVGPVVALMHVPNTLEVRSYKKGILQSDDCQSGTDKLNHAVLVVGYGIENGQDYWLVKNSWGESWGEDGYVKLPRNKNNYCGIASVAMYATA